MKELLFGKKTPLILLVIGQAATLYQWQMHSLYGAAYIHEWAAFVIAVATAFALDGAIVQVAFARKTHWLHWSIALLTSITFTALGVWIANTVTGDAMHGAFSIGIFLYSWYSAIVLNAEPVAMQPVETYARQMQYPQPVAVADNAMQSSAVADNAVTDNAVTDNAETLQRLIATPIAECNAVQSSAMQSNAVQRAVQNAETKHCPNCGAEVNANSFYRVQKRGYCKQCK